MGYVEVPSTTSLSLAMDIRLLIDSVVRQTTVLVAQLATTGGARAPLSHVAGQVFLELVSELDRQGLSRRVSADMFGLALRSYSRKVQRLSEGATERNRSLWEAVYGYLADKGTASRPEVLDRFRHDDETVVRGVLHDMVHSGLLLCPDESSPQARYEWRPPERAAALETDDGERIDEIVWATVYREGPISEAELAGRAGPANRRLSDSLERLCTSGRISCTEEGTSAVYSSSMLFVPQDDEVAWAAAAYDHYHTMVRTLTTSLRGETTRDGERAATGSTYTLEYGDGHPLAEEIESLFTDFRDKATALRARVDNYNKRHPELKRTRRLVTYGGQYLLEDESDGESED